MAAVTTMVVQVAAAVLAVASAVKQARDARKAKKKAEEAADARKGFEVTTEGESMSLPVVYGRNRIAGARVYHNTKSQYKHAAVGNKGTTYGYSLTRSLYGQKNEYLFIQQVLCQGTLNAVYDFTINDQARDHSDFKHGYRVNMYPQGNQADPMVVANYPDRASAVFTDSPYLSMCFRLNRDEPQYSGIPEVLAYVEGSLVHSVVKSGDNYSLSAAKSYSNNPALCLLDYLLSAKYGRGLALDEVDLESFYNGMTVCNTIVQNDVAANGRIWKAKNITRRNLPLYECNLIVDTAKPVRDNIIAILSCMGDADLIWSGGRYKLQVQYPGTVSDIKVAAVLTDEDIASEDVVVKYPSAAERMNLCTIKFADEANDFKESSVHWPKKGSIVHQTLLEEDNNVPLEKEYSEAGIVSSYYALAKCEELVRTSRSQVTYKFKAMLSSTLLEPGDVIFVNSPILNIINEYMVVSEMAVTDSSTADITAVKYDPAQLAWNAKDDEIVPPRNNYDFSLPGVLGSSILFVPNDAAILGDSLGMLKWDEPVDQKPSSYTIVARRIGTTDFISLGTTQVPRLEILSLKAGSYEFSIESNYPFGKRGPSALSNVIVIDALKAPSNVLFTPNNDFILNKSGVASWTLADDFRVTGYKVYLHKVGDVDGEFNPVFTFIGSTSQNKFVIPDLENTNVIIGVSSYTSSGAESERILSGTITINYPTPPTPTGLTAIAYGDRNDKVKLKWTIPTKRADNSTYNDHFLTVIYRRIVGKGAAWVPIYETTQNSYIDPTYEFGNLEYYVEFVSQRSKKGPRTAAVAVYVTVPLLEDLTPPPAPTNLVATASLNNIFLSWNIPSYDYGKGHGKTLIFAKEWPQGQTKPSFSDTYLAVSVDRASIYAFSTSLGKRWVFWAKEMSVDGGLSTAFAGPVDAQTGLIGNSDLGPGIIEAGNIADNSITNQKLLPDLEAILYYTGASLPTTNIAKTISWNGKLYKWDGSSYVAVVNTTDMVGTISTAQIANNAVSAAKFATGIEPVTVLTSVPTTKSTSMILVNGLLYKWNGTAYSPEVLAVNAVTTGVIATDAVTAEKIKDGVLNTALFAQDVEPIEVFTSVPSTKKTSTILVNGALYKWNGSEYVTQVLGTNAITADNITANAITAGKIAAGVVSATEIAANAIVADKIASNSVTAVKIAANAVTTDKLNANSVVADKIATNAIIADKISANAVTAVKIATDAVTADKIAANAITAGKIAAGVINSDHIQANSILASKIVLMDTSNVLPDGRMQDPASWSASSVFAHTLTPDTSYGIGGGAFYTKVLTGSGYNGPSSANIAVDGGREYYVSFKLRVLSASAVTGRIVAYAYDSVGTRIVSSTIGSLSVAAGSTGTVVGNVTFPADVVKATFFFQASLVAGVSNVVIGDPVVRLKSSSELIVDGAITADKIAANAITAAKIAANTITGDKIAANTITATQIAANTITAAEIATGAIVADKIAAGAITVGSAAIANGAISNAMIGNLVVDSAKIANGTITTAKIGDGQITTAKIGDAQISTAKIADAAITMAKISGAIQSDNYVANTSGWILTRSGEFEINGSVAGQGRLKITNQLIEVFDSNNMRRVRLGIWA